MTEPIHAGALLVSAAVHLIEWFSGVRNQSVGPLFLVNLLAAREAGSSTVVHRRQYRPA